MKRFLTAAFLFVVLSAHAQLSDDFETGNLDGWLQAPPNTWSATSATGRLNGFYTLRHTQTVNTSGTYVDCISKPISPFHLNDGTTIWRFRMRYNYNPTAGNKWAIILMADTSAIAWTDSAFNGYAIGVNQAETDKLLRLYTITDGVYSGLLNTGINWNTDIGTSSTTTVAIEVQRTSAGEWSCSLTKTGLFEDMQFYGSGINNEHWSAAYFGAINYYSSSSAGAQKLWIDDVSISSSAIPATIAGITQKGTTALIVRFTKAVHAENIQQPEHYLLSDGTIDLHPQSVTALSPEQLALTFEPLPRGQLVLTITGLSDENNNPVNDSKQVSIFYTLYGDIVINEIMAAPIPSVELPEVPYIELYNRLDIDVRMENWRLEYNATPGNIGTITIPAKGYLILCASAATDVFREYGVVTTVSYITSLTKSGKTLSLKNNEGTLIAQVAYSNKWNTDEIKQNGGWSLEKIDPDNLSESADNWTVSVDPKGGTPGQVNSVQASNPDTEAPFVSNLTYIDAHTLLLSFNELFDTIKAKNPLCYTINNQMGQPQHIVFDKAMPKEVTIAFSKPFQEGLIYVLTVFTPFCDLAGNPPESTSYRFGKFVSPGINDIVINEVLFNPPAGGVDFVEIYNRSDKIFDLTRLKIANRDKDNTVAAVQSVTQQYFLLPQEYAVLTTDLEAVRQFYTVPFPEKVIIMNTLPSYPNESGCVVLLSDEGTIVDEFLYTEKMHSGFISNAKGISLERVHPDRPGNERANWQSAAQDAGFATPTYRNSQYNNKEENSGDEFGLPYAVFSPDGDGYNDVLYIDYHLHTSGYVANITIYDAQGRLVKELERKTLLGISGRLAWDGTRYDQHKARPGMYIIFIEYFDLNGHVKRLKKTCALAGR